MRNDLLRFASGMVIAVLGLVPTVKAQQQMVPAGTSISVSLNQSVSSKDARVGQKLDGRVAADVIVNGKTLIRKGDKVDLSVASVRMAGPLSAPAKLRLQIDSIEVNGKMLAASASLVGQGDQPNAQRDAANAPGSESGALVDASSAGQGELVGASERSTAEAANVSAGTRQTDITIAAKTKLRFTLRASVQLN